MAGQAASTVPSAAWEPTLINLGHMYRKQWQWTNAIATYERALSLKPGQAGTYAALGFTHHLMVRLALCSQVKLFAGHWSHTSHPS